MPCSIRRCVDGPTAPMPATAGDISLRRSFAFVPALEERSYIAPNFQRTVAVRPAYPCGASHSWPPCYLRNSGPPRAVAECIHRCVDCPTTPIDLDRRRPPPSGGPFAFESEPTTSSAPSIAFEPITSAWAVTRVTAGTIRRWQSAPIDALIVPQRRSLGPPEVSSSRRSFLSETRTAHFGV
jgi:hypothetical protein